MNTGKALIAGLAVTIGLLAVSYGFEGIAQLVGDFPAEEETADLEVDEETDEEDVVDLGGSDDGDEDE